MADPTFTQDDVDDLHDMQLAFEAMFGVKIPGAVLVRGLGEDVSVSAGWISTCESLRERIQRSIDQQNGWQPTEEELTRGSAWVNRLPAILRLARPYGIIDETDLSEG